MHFRPFLHLWPWPWHLPDDLHIRTWSVYRGSRIYRICENELSTSSLHCIQPANACTIVTRGHFQSRDKDGGHTIRRNQKPPWCYTQTWWLYLLQDRSYGRSKFYIAGIGTFLVPFMWPDDLHIQPFPYCREIRGMCKYELPTSGLSKDRHYG